MYRWSIRNHKFGTAISSARCFCSLKAGYCYVDQKISKAFDINIGHCELFDAGIGSQHETHASVPNNAFNFGKNHHVPVHVYIHEDSGFGRSNRNLPGNGWENQNNIGRIFQVSFIIIIELFLPQSFWIKTWHCDTTLKPFPEDFHHAVKEKNLRFFIYEPVHTLRLFWWHFTAFLLLLLVVVLKFSWKYFRHSFGFGKNFFLSSVELCTVTLLYSSCLTFAFYVFFVLG